MNKPIAFTNCTESKSAAIASAKRHVELDLLMQGTYYDGEKGCSIGCHYGGNNHQAAPAKHGFSIPFVYLCDKIFEAQPNIQAAQEFHIWVVENVAEGVDTMKIWWEFFALTVDGIGPDWAEFAAECRMEEPDLAKLSALALARARALDLDLALDIDRARALDIARDLDLDLARALARDLARDIARDLARDRDRDLDLALDIDLDLARARARALALALDRDLDLDRALDRDLDTANFKKAVLKFAEPEKTVSL